MVDTWVQLWAHILFWWLVHDRGREDGQKSGRRKKELKKRQLDVKILKGDA